MKQKNTLVKASDIKKLTGWSHEEFRKARKLGWVKMVGGRRTLQSFSQFVCDNRGSEDGN
jgi:hypothetical protein